MFYRSLLFCIFLLLAGFAFSQDSVGVLSLIKKHISILASDSMQGRRAGTQFEKKTYRYIIDELTKTELKTLGKNWVHPFTFTDEEIITKTAYNIIAQIDNKSKKTIVLGAHYDHLGLGGVKSRSIGKKAIHN